MAMALTGVGPALEPFDLEGPAHEVSARWRRWKQTIIPVLYGWAEHNIREETEESVAVLGWYASTGEIRNANDDPG